MRTNEANDEKYSNECKYSRLTIQRETTFSDADDTIQWDAEHDGKMPKLQQYCNGEDILIIRNEGKFAHSTKETRRSLCLKSIRWRASFAEERPCVLLYPAHLTST